MEMEHHQMIINNMDHHWGPFTVNLYSIVDNGETEGVEPLKLLSLFETAMFLLLLALLSTTALATADDGYNVFAGVPEGDYDVGSVVPVNASVFKNGEYFDPKDIHINVEQYDETQRRIEMTMLGQGRYTSNINIQLSDINKLGAVHYAVVAFFDPDYKSDRGYVETVFDTAFRADIILIDPNDDWVSPGQDVEVEVKVTHKGEQVDPDPGTLIVTAELDSISLTRIAKGRYTGTFHVPGGGTESAIFTLRPYANYTVDGRTWSLRGFSSYIRAIPLQFSKVWAHHENVTRESTDLTICVEDMTGNQVEGASVHLEYWYRAEDRSYPRKYLNGTTDGNGLCTFHLSYPDVSNGSVWFNVKGNMDIDGYRQNFEGLVYIPPKDVPSVGRTDGKRHYILTEGPLPVDEEVVIEFLVEVDGEPLPGEELIIFAESDNEILFHGIRVTGDDGKTNITIIPGSSVICVKYYYWVSDWDGDRLNKRERWFNEPDPRFPREAPHIDQGTTIIVEPLAQGGPVMVTLENPDADGTDERAVVLWAVGPLDDYWYEPTLPDWQRWDPTPVLGGRYMMGPINSITASWHGDSFKGWFILPPFLPADVEIFVLGLIEFTDSPTEDIRGALYEGLTATLPHPILMVNLIFPVEGGRYSKSIEFLGVAFSETSVEVVELKIDNGDWMIADGTSNWTLRLELPTGEHTVTARCSDGKIYSSEERVHFYIVDKTADDGQPAWVLWALIFIVGLLSILLGLYGQRRRRD
jgi:hypothetical protein